MNNLREINEVCKEKIKSLESYELIEKILFDRNTIENIGKRLNLEFYHWSDWAMVYNIKETITIFLVGCAKYFYNDRQGGFWDAVKTISGIKDHNKPNIIRAFHTTLALNSLEKFEEEKVEGYTQMGTILAHAGLPEGLEDALVRNIASLRFYDIPFERLGDECIENCLYAPKTIISYLNIMNRLGTLNDFVYDVLQLLKSDETIVDESLSIAETLQSKIIQYRSSNDYRSRSEISQRVTRPTLNYDTDSNFVYIEIPELRNETSPKLKIQVRNGEDIILKNLYENGFEKGNYVFRNSILKLEPAKTITVCLYDDLDKEIWKYELKKAKECILFNNKGEFEKNKSLSSKGGYILIDDEFTPLNDQELINSFDEVNIFAQPETELENIIFKNNEEDYIKIPIKKPIEITDGERLFGENCKFQGVDAYYNLPILKVPFSGEWLLSISSNNNKETFALKLDETQINLEEFITENQFGKISIRLYNKLVGYKTFKFLYLPYVEKDVSGYLPGPEGFRKSKIHFKFNNSNIKILDINLKETNILECKEDEEKVLGIYEFNDQRYNFSIMIRPYSWRIENNNDVLFQPNTKGYLSLKDITKFGDCILTFRNNTDEKVYIKVNNNQEEPKFIKIYPNSKRVISLKEYFEYISNSESETLIYVEQDFKKLCDICSFRINLAIRDLRLSSFSKDYDIIMWEEDGLQKNRELRCRYLSRPYEFFSRPIADGQTMVSIDRNSCEYHSNFIAEIALVKERSIFDVQQNEKIEILDSSNSVIVDLFAEELPFTDFNIENEDEFNNCFYSYLTYRFNKNLISDTEIYKKTLTQLLRKLISARIIYGDEKIIATLLKYNIDKKMFEQLSGDLRMYMPVITNNPISSNNFRQLEKLNPYMYIIYSLIKCDYEQIGRLLSDNCSYFDRFVDNDSFLFSHKFELFKDIDTIEELQPRVKSAKAILRNIRDEQAYLMALIEYMLKMADKYTKEDETLLVKFSGYIKNVYQKYPRTLLDEFFKQASRRK